MNDPLNPEQMDKESSTDKLKKQIRIRLEQELRSTLEDEDKEPSADELKKQIQARLGEQLRSARERRKLTIMEVSSQLRIRKVYLQGLESGDWKHLPEEVYVLGFLRQYADLLDENCDEDIETLKSSNYQLTKPYTIPDPPIAPGRMWAIAAAVLFVLLFILFNTMGDDENGVPPPVEKAESVKSLAPEEMPVKNTIPVTQRIASSEAEKPAVNPDTKASPATSSPATSGKELKIMHHYRLTAIELSAWLQVYDSSGTLLKEALLHPGQSLLLENEAPFLMVTCGNAAALQIEVDHTLYAAAGTLGTRGKVLHEFRIDASSRAR